MSPYPLHTLKQFIFYSSYFIFPFLLFLLYIFYRFPRKKTRVLILFLFLLSGIFIYARFIEPKLLVVKNETIFLAPPGKNIPEIKIAIFSDLHRGLYTNSVSLQKIVRTVNKEHPDLVLIPGDFVYELEKKDIPHTFADLKNFEAPTYAVTGNHDVGFPGEDVGQELDDTLRKNGIKVIDNTLEKIQIKGHEVSIVGLSDLWQGQANYTLLQNVPKDNIVLALTHNPDSAFAVTEPDKIDVLFAGHTHGGQIRLPVLYRYAIPTKYNFDKGLHFANSMNVFVTTGIGMIGLPFRFLMPPRLDIVTLNFQEQTQNNSVFVPKQIK